MSPETLTDQEIAMARAAEAAARLRQDPNDDEPPLRPKGAPETLGAVVPRFTAPDTATLEANAARWRLDDEDRARRERHRAVSRSVEAIPPRFRGLALGDPAKLAERGITVALVEQSRRAITAPGVVWMGPVGSGKTTLACASMNTWAHKRERPPSLLFANATELACARTRHPLGAGEPPLVEQAMRVDLLVLDNLGDEVALSTSGETIREVVAHRYDYCLPTWVTTAAEMEALRARYEAGTIRRLFEMSTCVVCPARKA